MPIINASDLATNIYPEVINEITRNDSTITTTAISAAIQETKMYLGRYDLVQLFGTDTINPTLDDPYLKALVKDIACWHLLRLCNSGASYTAYRTAYLDAIEVLKNIMNGKAQPQGWLYVDTTMEVTAKGDSINWSSNVKRNNYY